MLQPKKDNFRLNQADQASLEKEMIAYAEEGATDADLIEFKNTYVAEKKKGTAQSTPISTPPKSVSGTPTGSSGGVNPAFKSSIPSPIPDFNSMESVKKPIEKLKNPPVKEDTSFFDYLKEGLDTGIAIASKSIYDTPALLYDNVAGLITNPIFRAMGVDEDKLASSKKLADNLGFKNIPSEILKEKIKVSNEKLNDYALKNGVDPLTAIEKGEYKNAAKLVAGTTMQSLPLMVVALLSGGSKAALTAIGLSTASTKNSELEESNPEMGLGTRVVNANNAGIIEAVTGHLFTGGSGAVMKKIIADKGVEAGSKIIGKSFRTTIEKSIEKNPLVGAFGEVIEESAVEFGNQVNDISSGIRTELDFRAIKNAGLSATGMGGLQTLGVYGAKGYVKAKEYAKLKNINKQVFKLRSEIDNGNLSPENKAILSLRADRLEAENKKLLGTEIEKAKALPTEAKTELNALNNEFEDLKTKFDDIDDADDIPDNLKPAIKEEIKLQASKNQKRKTEILSQNDGIEIDNDFSKFEGVEPDFNLENGKISSLPLKEQDRLNKLAVEKITNGDKAIEYTKEQVSETANEIYKNEQTPPTPEAQPQAEVPQQAEAEKVSTEPKNVNTEPTSVLSENKEVSPVEDVVATSVEKRKYNFTKTPSLENVQAIEIKDANIDNEPEITEKIINNQEHWDKALVDGVKNEGNGWFEVGKTIQGESVLHAPSTNETVVIKDSQNKGGRNGAYKNNFIENNPRNEAAPETNPPTNGNVQLGASNVGESGNYKQESPVQESVSKPVDGGEVKGDASVGEFSEFEKVVNESKTADEAFYKIKNIQGVSSETSKSFREKYDPKSELSTKEAFGKFYDEVKAKPQVNPKKGEKPSLKTDADAPIIGVDEVAKQDTPVGKKKNQFKTQEEYLKENVPEDAPESSSYYKRGGFLSGKYTPSKSDLEEDFIESHKYFVEEAMDKENAIFDGKDLWIADNQEGVWDNQRTSEVKNIENPPKGDITSFYEYSIKNGDITANEVVKIIESAGLTVPKSIRNLSETPNPKPTTKERIAERIKLSDAKVDDIKAHIKGIDNIFGIKIKIDDVEGLNKNGIDFVEVIASIAKQAIAAGIHIDEAINKTIEHFKGKYDFDVNIDEIKERINPKKEAEKETASDSDMEDFRDSWNLEPSSDEINQYDSGRTITREHGETRNNQDYEVQKDFARVQIGIRAIEHAKRLFGAEYVEKTLSFIEKANLSPEKKAVAYVLLENEMDARAKEFPNNVGVQKLQDLVRAKSQEFLANSARAMGAGRFRIERFRELAKNGFSEDEFTNAILTTKQKNDKGKIQKLIQVSPDDINNESENQESDDESISQNNEAVYTQEDFDRELQKAKDELGNDYNISVFENLKRQAKKDKLSDKKDDLKAAKAKVLEDIRKVVRESMGQMSVNPLAKPLEFAALVTKLAKLHIQDGALSLEEVANNIYNDLKDMSKDISKESIFNILKSKPKRVMSEATKRKIYINLLNKNIASLDAQIEAKKRDVITRVDKYKNDAEIKDLRDKRSEKREELAKVDPSYAESRKLATDLKLAQKSLDEHQRRIDENDLSPKEKEPKVVAEKLKKLRERRDAKRKEFLAKKKKYDDSLKPVIVPPTKEELADKKHLSDVNNKINSLTKRIDDLKANKPKTNDGKSTVWSADISKLENELKDLRESKKAASQKITEKEPLSEEDATRQRIDKKIAQREKVLKDLIDGKKKDVTGKNSDWSAEISKVNSEIERLMSFKKQSNKRLVTIKNIVKQSLIDAGFSREITVTTKNGKEKRTILDWKKLAGEAGIIDNIRKNVEESLKGSKYSKAEIEDMKEALEDEYVRLSEDVIEKGLNELQNRNAERKPVNTKSAAKKLAELYNYGLFEKNKDSYEKIINSVLGFNGLDQMAFDEMKEIARGYAVLMDSGLSDTEIKSAVNSLSRRQSRLVATLAFSQADWKFKLAVALSEITNLSTRFKLVNLGNLAENVSSGMMARAANNMMDAIANGISGKKTSNKAIREQSKITARAKLRGITLETAESYGDTSSLLLNHSAVEDYFNNATTNKAYHALISTYMAKPVLEGADSYNKILITEAKMVRATIKVLEAKGMSNSDALDYVAKAITGESMQEALVKAKALIEKVNEDAGRKLLNDSESSIKSLAADIVKESLVSGGQLTESELKAIYTAAYKSAGKDIGHVSNNWVTDQISAKGAQIEKEVADAIKEKKWGVASGVVVEQIFWKNFVSTFVGGGTNWFVKGLQKSANPLSLFSLRKDIMHLKMAGKLDVTTDEGIKNMEESLYRGMNLRSTSATMLMGFIITTSIISALSASGADDEIAEWLKENQWAKKFFDKMVPDAVVLMLAIKDKDFGRYIAKMVNVKADFFDDQKNTYKILEKYAKGYTEDDAVKISEASGDLGAMLGKRFELPGPLRAAKDMKQIYKGVVKGEYDKTNYYTSGFMNGFFQGGIIDMWGLRKDPDFIEDDPIQKFLKEQKEKELLYKKPENEKVKIRVDRKLTRVESDVKLLQNLKTAQQKGLPYFISMDAALTKQQVKDMDLSGTDESVARIKQIVSEVKAQYGIEDEE